MFSTSDLRENALIATALSRHLMLFNIVGNTINLKLKMCLCTGMHICSI